MIFFEFPSFNLRNTIFSYSKDVNGIDITACIHHVDGCGKGTTQSSTETPQTTTTDYENGGMTTRMSIAIFSVIVSLLLFVNE